MKKIHILHTNDIHSHFEQMPFIANGIRKLKKELSDDGDQVAVVDLGDHMDRMSYMTEATMGQANIEVMNKTGYEIVSIGNNEGLTFPKSQLEALYRDAQFQVICHNLIDQKTEEYPVFSVPFKIEQRDDLRIGWISVTAAFQTFYELLGWTVLDPFQQIELALSEIRGQVDVIILLSHLGLYQDRKIAERYADIKVIIGAHTHELLMDGEYSNGTFIIQAGKFGQYIGRTTIEYDPQPMRIESVYGTCYEVSPFGEATDIQMVINKWAKEAEQILSPSVTVLENSLPVQWSKESPLGNLLAAGIRDWVQAEVSMVNAGQLLFSLPAGSISRRDLLEVCPHPINPCIIYLTGMEIWETLELSLYDGYHEKEIRGFGFRGKVLGWMCVDGMNICFDEEREEGKRIIDITIEGQSIEKNRVYSVGSIDMFTFSRVYPLLREATNVKYFLPEFIRDVLSEELCKYDQVKSSNHKRWIRFDPKKERSS